MRKSSRRAPILVVEDDPATRELLLTALADAGYDADGAADGREALIWCRERRPALVLLDLVLPLVSGEQVAAFLRQAYGEALPILVVTARDRPAPIARGLGGAIFIHKPFKLATVLAAVRALLDVDQRS